MRKLPVYVLGFGALLSLSPEGKATHGGPIVYGESRIEKVYVCSNLDDAIRSMRPVQQAIKNGIGMKEYISKKGEQTEKKLDCKAGILFYTPQKRVCEGKLYGVSTEGSEANPVPVRILESSMPLVKVKEDGSVSATQKTAYVFSDNKIPEPSSPSCLDEKFDPSKE